MKCEESLAMIEEYFDGELDPQTGELLLTHIRNCALCAGELQQLTQEHQAYQKYERRVDVNPALWAGVRSRIVADDSVQPLPLLQRWQIGFNNLRSLRFSVPVLALLVMLAVVATVMVMNYLAAKKLPDQMASSPDSRLQVNQAETPNPGASRKRNEPEVLVKEEVEKLNGAVKRTVTRTASRNSAYKANPAEARTPSQLVRDAEKNYLTAIAMLTRDVAQRPSQLDSGTRAKLDGALASIDRTISATRRAVQENPNDPVAVQYMLTAYAKKVDVLKEMTNY
jgi:hypothetical protein